MMNIDISPEAFNDITKIKEYVQKEFGNKEAVKAVKGVFKDIRTLGDYPNTGLRRIFEKFNIVTDYMYIVSGANYIFYRIENDNLKIVRVLNSKMDILYVLFGIREVDDDSDDYWDE